MSPINITHIANPDLDPTHSSQRFRALIQNFLNSNMIHNYHSCLPPMWHGNPSLALVLIAYLDRLHWLQSTFFLGTGSLPNVSSAPQHLPLSSDPVA